MTRLEQIEYRLNYLLSRYEGNNSDPTLRLQIAILATERRKLMAQEKPAEVD